MKKVIKAKDLLEGEVVYLRKDMLGYRIVHPIKNEEGKINLLNLLVGGWRNLIHVIIILLVIGLFFYGHSTLTQSYIDASENPCDYCQTYQNIISGKPVCSEQDKRSGLCFGINYSIPRILNITVVE